MFSFCIATLPSSLHSHAMHQTPHFPISLLSFFSSLFLLSSCYIECWEGTQRNFGGGSNNFLSFHSPRTRSHVHQTKNKNVQQHEKKCFLNSIYLYFFERGEEIEQKRSFCSSFGGKGQIAVTCLPSMSVTPMAVVTPPANVPSTIVFVSIGVGDSFLCNPTFLPSMQVLQLKTLPIT